MGTPALGTQTGRLDFSPLLLTPLSLDAQIGAALDRALQFMRQTTPMALFDAYARGVSPSARRLVEDAVICIDHAGLIAPAGTHELDLRTVASRHGFTQHHRSFASVIVASELTALNGGVPVPTTIFRGTAPPRSSEQPSYGIEIFVPETDAAVVTGWVRRGVGTHVAFRLAMREDVDRLCDGLRAQGLDTPSFMNGAPMSNQNDGTRTVYFDVPIATGTFRLEFFHRDAC